MKQVFQSNSSCSQCRYLWLTSKCVVWEERKRVTLQWRILTNTPKQVVTVSMNNDNSRF
jgi:hypothetical protein